MRLGYKTKKVLVTGGAGFIGFHLTDKLLEMGFKVVVIDNLSSGKKENINKKAKFYKVDIKSFKISQLFKKEKPEIVFHLAANINLTKSVIDPIFDAKENILGTINILENCKDYKIKKIIFASTGGAIYGEADIIPTPEDYLANPLSPYGISKFTVEKYLNYFKKFFGLPFIALRFSNIYGPCQNAKGEAGVIAIFCQRMILGKKVIIYGSGKQTRDFIFVEDAVKALILAARNDKTGIFNIGTGKETDINTIFEKLRKISQYEQKVVYGPEKIGEQKRSCLNWSLAKKELNWEPKYSLDDGLKKTVNWFKNNVDIRHLHINFD